MNSPMHQANARIYQYDFLHFFHFFYFLLINFFNIQVTDSKGHTAFHRENLDKGKFAVVSDEDDIFDFCFVTYLQHGQHAGPAREVHLEMKHGAEAKNYEEVIIFGYKNK